MELVVLGGAAACPNPGQGSSSYLVKSGSENILLDCGPNTLQELRKHVDLDQIDHVVVSHVHADHTLDLVPFRYGLKYAPGLDQSRPQLHMPPTGNDFLQRVATAYSMGAETADDFWSSTFEVSEYQPEEILSLRDVQIRFLRTNHPVPCWAIRLESSAGTLVYLADTGPQESLVEFARDADILICEGTYPELDAGMSDDRPHLSAFEAGAIARDASAGMLILTHLWATAGLDRYLAQAAAGFGRPAMIAQPGLRVAVDQFSREETTRKASP